VAMLMCRAWRRGCELVGCEPAAGWGMLRCFCRRRPGAQAVAAALGALVSVGAVMHGREALTPLGLHLAALPVDVRCGRPRVVMGVLLELRESFRDMAGACTRAGVGLQKADEDLHALTHKISGLSFALSCMERATCWQRGVPCVDCNLSLVQRCKNASCDRSAARQLTWFWCCEY